MTADQGGHVSEPGAGQVYRVRVGEPAVTFYCSKIVPTPGGFEARECFVADYVRHDTFHFIVDYRRDQGIQKFSSAEPLLVETLAILPWMQMSLEDAKVELKIMAESPFAADESEFFKRVLTEFVRARNGEGQTGEA